uniref:SAP30-binding protein n=1 Tax=Pyramimonas obovata TaxID=1411642 RepID=A0A7S0WS14_9CHLO|mmetsp:Transcript_37232/g.81070  ORF Transcript_37232/g.81070 Transcript_37232/m.81070 type:complete len:295 (+) Transcript_37232:249-1133(+)|eukprot:CAMPEP_0118930256 /NCGR_PEP_ID=MMETSP1169-20130426/7001_1 /TAXON_ID=36882 /ORGANISM="Pyramimonas obovata, Strain CCMP722" /LENGTH=294 /DNA_ID=CAMNT_0006872581 /DNA_START=218 /DNA_END=1102 /DNA_ORIENTATION=-
MSTGKRKASSSALTSLFASYGSDSDDEDGEIKEEGAGEGEEEENENHEEEDTTLALGRGGIVVYGGEEPGSSPASDRPNAQEPPTAAPTGPAVPLGPVEGMPMPSVDVVIEEKDESLNMARRLFPDMELPDKPEEACSEELQAKINKYLELKAQGRSINSELRKSKGYRNPDFLQKITKHFNIKELDSHFPKEVFDPEGYAEEDYFDKLVMADTRPKAGAKREFVTAGAQGGAVAQRPLVTRVEGVKPMAGIPPIAASLPTTAATAAVLQQQALQNLAAAQAAAVKPKSSKWDN